MIPNSVGSHFNSSNLLGPGKWNMDVWAEISSMQVGNFCLFEVFLNAFDQS